MEALTGRTAVVTGAASGIGRAMVERFAAEGMRVVLADIEPDALAEATDALVAGGAEAIGVRTDVTDIASVQALSDAARERFGHVHVLCNNAGVGPPAEPQLWLNTPNDWRWTFEVNVFGVVNGLNVFMPHMVEHGEHGHVINTSSTDGGIVAMPSAGVYASSKAAVVTLTECLAHQLKELDSRIGASVLFPRGGPAAHRPVDLRSQPAGLARAGTAPVAAGHDRRVVPGAHGLRRVARSRSCRSRRWPAGPSTASSPTASGSSPTATWTTRSAPDAEAIIDRKQPYVHVAGI